MSLEETDEELDSFMKMKDYLFMQTQGDVEVKNMFDKFFYTGYCILSKYMYYISDYTLNNSYNIELIH